ncbi:MAG: FecR domain-containing protein [Verrucomicrobia bacterium]|nr:FecR domain-containing protein [Verrucomicrobiota bacterium]
MKLSDRERIELNELCSALIDDVMTDAQRQRLEQLLAMSPDARRHYVRAMALSASLMDYAGEMQVEAAEGACQPAEAASPFPWRWILGTLSAAAAIVAAFWLGGFVRSGGASDFGQPEIVGHLSGVKDCRWAGPELPPGGPLQRGQRVDLAAGFAEITFDSGAQVVLEGPASLDLNSSWEAALRHGALTGNVSPEAMGFRVSNTAVDVVNLGTEFSMLAEKNGATEVFVLAGAVEVSPRNLPSAAARRTLVLAEKQARRFARNGIVEVRDGEQKLQRFLRKVPFERFARPARFVHWSFDEAKGTRIAAEIVGAPAESYEVEIEDSLPPAREDFHVEGRWKRALNCDGQIYAQAPLPDFASSPFRTVAFWIRIPSDANAGEAGPMLAWALSSGDGVFEVAWNRVPAQGAFGALRTSFGRGVVIGTAPLRDGQWHHVALVISSVPRAAAKTQIKQYVDGRLDRVSAKHFAKRAGASGAAGATALIIAEGRLWIAGKPDEAGRIGFRGALDELFVVDRALTQKEIRALMLQNRIPASDTLAIND